MSQQYISHEDLPEALNSFFEEMKKELADATKRVSARYGFDFERDKPFKDHKIFAWEIYSDSPCN